MNEGLRVLLLLKLRGTVRRQLLRLKTPAGALLFLLGLALFGLWIASLVFGYQGRHERALDDALRGPLAQLALTMMLAVTASSALTYRGLYLPAEEIERLFSAPVSRRDMIRYRLLVAIGRSLFGALLLGLLARSWARVPLYGFLGAALTTMTLPLVGQALSILAGDAENRLVNRLPMRTLRAIVVGGALGLWIVVMFLFFGAEDPPGVFRELGFGGGLTGILATPVVRTLTAPALPWANMIMAPDWTSFVRWASVCSLTWLALFELTTRLGIDFRELSLQTSADVARRLTRVRQGGIGASASRASKRTVGWRVPRIFGRGPAGAIAWRKALGILRKARGTALTAIAIIAFLTLMTSMIAAGDDPRAILGGAAILVGTGALYLGGGLRFDFRDDLDHMEVIKAWPVPPWKVFLATIAPQVVLVTVLLCVALALRVLLTRQFHPLLLAFPLAIPPVTLTWVALDNIVFLFLPVRYMPGQDGALQHSGRLVVTLFLRLVLLVLTSCLVSAGALLGWSLASRATPSVALRITVAGGVGLAGLLVVAGALVWVGGRMLRRFDVARDRP